MNNKEKVIKMVQKEMKEVMEGEDFFDLVVVSKAVYWVRHSLTVRKQQLKENRPLKKLLAKHGSPSELIEHDKKFRDINQQLYHLNNLDQFKFLKRGRYYPFTKEEEQNFENVEDLRKYDSILG